MLEHIFSFVTFIVSFIHFARFIPMHETWDSNSCSAIALIAHIFSVRWSGLIESRQVFLDDVC